MRRNILEHALHSLSCRSDNFSSDSNVSQRYVVFPIHILNIWLPKQVYAEVCTHSEVPLEGENLLLICLRVDIVNWGPVVVRSVISISDLELYQLWRIKGVALLETGLEDSDDH